MTSVEEMVSSESNTKMGQNESGQKPTEEVPEGEVANEETNGKGSSKDSCSKVLEWNFIDFSKTERCPIYDVNPVMLKKFVGHNVTVYNTSREEFHGCCLAIDPVSLSVILGRRVPEGKIRIITLPGYHLAKIFVNPECVPPEAQVSVNDLDIAELYHAPSLLPSGASEGDRDNGNASDMNVADVSLPINEERENESKREEGDGAVAPTFSESEVQTRREKLKDLLTKQRLPFTDKDGVLELPGGVKIEAPYTLETCDTKGNQMIKKKLRDLIASL